mgnify:CR=1 FL=1
MVDYKVSPADQEILKTITAKSTWNDLTVSFRNKILPAGNLNKAIGERCAKLLKTLIKKDKVSSSTLSKAPVLRKQKLNQVIQQQKDEVVVVVVVGIKAVVVKHQKLVVKTNIMKN